MTGHPIDGPLERSGADDIDPAEHPDLETLADLRAGAVGEPAAATALSEHTARCESCRLTLLMLDDAVEAIRADLRALPVPPMPGAVAARLADTMSSLRAGPPQATAGRRQAADSAAVPGSLDPADSSADPPAETPASTPAGSSAVADLADARSRRRRHWAATRIAGWAAAAVVVIAALFGVGSVLNGQGDESNTAASSHTGLTESGAEPDGAAGQRRRSAPTGAAAGAQGRDAAVPSYRRDTLAAAIPLIEQRALAVPAPSDRTPTSTAGGMADPQQRANCLAGISSFAGVTGRLTAVVQIMFEGRPAYLFILRPGSTAEAVVVAPTCGVSPSNPVLYRTSR